MPDQPAGTNAQEMIDSILRIIILFQFLLQSRKRFFPKIIVQTPVHIESHIMYLGHISFFFRKMLHRMVLKIFDPFFADPPAFPFLLFMFK